MERVRGDGPRLPVFKDSRHRVAVVPDLSKFHEWESGRLVFQVNGFVVAVKFQRRRALFLGAEAGIFGAAERQLILDAGAGQVDRQQAGFQRGR